MSHTVLLVWEISLPFSPKVISECLVCVVWRRGSSPDCILRFHHRLLSHCRFLLGVYGLFTITTLPEMMLAPLRGWGSRWPLMS